MTRITLRLASEKDSQDIFFWRSDPHTRAMSKQTSDFSYDEHLKWFQAFLASPTAEMYIGLEGNKKIGMCRFDLVLKDHVSVSINLNPTERGRGLSRDLLMESIRQFRRKKNNRLIAEIKTENYISQKIFSSCNFEPKEKLNDIILYEFNG